MKPVIDKWDGTLEGLKYLTETRLKALGIAASVFAQITAYDGDPALRPLTPRTLKDFRESVDAVFNAAGLEKVDWGE